MWKLGLLPDCFTYTTKYNLYPLHLLFYHSYSNSFHCWFSGRPERVISSPQLLPSVRSPALFRLALALPLSMYGPCWWSWCVVRPSNFSLLYCLRVTTVLQLWFPEGAEAWWMHILPFSVNRWCSCPAGSLPGRREWATCSRVAGLPGEGHVPGLLLGWGMIPELNGMQGCCWPEAGLLLLPLSEPSITPGPCLGRMSPASSLIPYRKSVVFQFSQVWGLPSFNQELGYDRNIFLLCCK